MCSLKFTYIVKVKNTFKVVARTRNIFTTLMLEIFDDLSSFRNVSTDSKRIDNLSKTYLLQFPLGCRTFMLSGVSP